MAVFGEPELRNLERVLDSGLLSRPDGACQELEEAFAARVGSRFGIARNSAMTALAQLVAVSGAGTGTEVICDPLVHYGGIAALTHNAVPRFVDVDPATWLMDVDAVEAAMTPRTRAVVVTHLWGVCADIERLSRLCRDRDVFLIEDCAHALGATWDGQHAGTFGDAGVFSFEQSKQLPTGQGGMIVTDHEDLARLLHMPWPSGESPSFLTLNFRMNELTAAVGLAQLERVDGYLATHRETIGRFDDAVAECPWLRSRSVPSPAGSVAYWWARTWHGDEYGLTLEDFARRCEEAGIDADVGFTERPASEYPIFATSTAYGVPDCPVRCPFYDGDHAQDPALPAASALLPRLVTIPITGLSPDEGREQADALRRIVREA